MNLVFNDGNIISYTIKYSPRARNIRLKVTIDDGLVVVAPQNCDVRFIQKVVQDKASWVLKTMQKADEIRRSVSSGENRGRPEAIELPSVGEYWPIDYREIFTRGTTVRPDPSGRLLVTGAVNDSKAIQAALQRWLTRRAREILLPWLERLARDMGLKYHNVAIRGQKTRWGSCSHNKTINLNYKLLFLPQELVNYVLIHELGHLVEMNHSQKFWNYIERYQPQAKKMHRDLHKGWAYIPDWLNSGSGQASD